MLCYNQRLPTLFKEIKFLAVACLIIFLVVQFFVVDGTYGKSVYTGIYSLCYCYKNRVVNENDEVLQTFLYKISVSV